MKYFLGTLYSAIILLFLFGKETVAQGPEHQFYSFPDDGKIWYCAGDNFDKMDMCELRGPLFPMGSALDWALRSRWKTEKGDGNTTWSTNPKVPGMMADAKMKLTMGNYYVTSSLEVTATVQVDHILCPRDNCSSFLNLYWGEVSSSGNITLAPLIYYSDLGEGTELSAMPFMGIRAMNMSITCNDAMDGLGLENFPDTLKVWRCNYSNWEEPEWCLAEKLLGNQAVVPMLRVLAKNYSALDNSPNTFGNLYSEKDEDSNVTMSIGNFMDDITGKCIQLIVPLSEDMKLLGWDMDDNCTNAADTFLFNTYHMQAYSNQLFHDASEVAPPVRDPATWQANLEKALHSDNTSSDYWDAGRGYYCEYYNAHTLSIKLPLGRCKLSTLSDVKANRSSISVENSFHLLAISGRPIWALSVNGVEDSDPISSGLSFYQELHRSALAAVRHPWCSQDQTPGWSPSIRADKGTRTSVYDCEVTKRMDMLNLKTKGQKLRKLVDGYIAKKPCFFSGTSWETDQLVQLVGIAINNTLLQVATIMREKVTAVLANSDSTATTFGSFTNLVVTLLSSFITFLGVGDAFDACARITDKLNLSPAIPAAVISLAMAGALVISPTTFLIQEISASRQNPDGKEESIFWTRIRVNDGSSLASAVSISYRASRSPVAKPFGIIAIVVASLALLFCLWKVWREVYRRSTTKVSRKLSILRRPVAARALWRPVVARALRHHRLRPEDSELMSPAREGAEAGKVELEQGPHGPSDAAKGVENAVIDMTSSATDLSKHSAIFHRTPSALHRTSSLLKRNGPDDHAVVMKQGLLYESNKEAATPAADATQL